MMAVSQIKNCCFLLVLFFFINVFFTSIIYCERLSVENLAESEKFERVKDLFRPSRTCYDVPVKDTNRKTLWLTALTHPELLNSKNKNFLQSDVAPPFVGKELRKAVKIFNSLKDKELDSESSSVIMKDLGRTSLNDNMYYKDLNEPSTKPVLKNLLEAISKYSDAKYAQGMNFIGAFLLDNMTLYEAFLAFTRILENPNLDLKTLFQEVLNVNTELHILLNLLKKYVPKSRKYINSLSAEEAVLQVSPFISPFLRLFVAELPHEVTVGIWDCLMRYGRKVIFATFVAFCQMNQKVFKSSSMPFQEIYESFRKVTPKDAKKIVTLIRKFTRRISDSTIERMRKTAPKFT